jgi:superfamily II DNA/RNA helicase
MSSTFKSFGLRAELQRSLDEAGYETPMPIQELAIPILLSGRDLIGVAQTGTGKTLAFLLPIFERLRPAGDDPQAVVICPTRELALQVAGEAERFGGHLGVRTVTAYGGTSSGEQKQALVRGCDLVVATPGRLLDFVTSAWLSLRRIRFLVLDEADRMLDMGFINDVDAIVRKAPMSRQTMLFSATFPPEIRGLADRYLLHPETVRIDTGTRVKASVEHAIYPVSAGRKVDLLLEIMERDRPAKTLIFTATREGTSDLARQLRRGRHEVVSLSSLLSQANRERALGAFRRGEFDVLVATDVAARGLDITDIDLVVNFDVPMHAEDYVHRIGRTGRAERTGKAVTLVTPADGRRVSAIEFLLKEPVPVVRLENFAYGYEGGPPAGSRQRSGGASGGSRSREAGDPAGSEPRRPLRRRRSSSGAAGGKGGAGAPGKRDGDAPHRRR